MLRRRNAAKFTETDYIIPAYFVSGQSLLYLIFPSLASSNIMLLRALLVCNDLAIVLLLSSDDTLYRQVHGVGQDKLD